MTKEGKWTPEGAPIFQASAIELDWLGLLVFVVYSVALLARSPERPEEEYSNPDVPPGDMKDNSKVAAPSARRAVGRAALLRFAPTPLNSSP